MYINMYAVYTYVKQYENKEQGIKYKNKRWQEKSRIL